MNSNNKLLKISVIFTSFIILFYASTVFLKNALVDDSLIYLRVANNITNGKGWSYNEGDISNPCTSPLYVVLLTILLFLRIPGENALLLLYSAALFGGIILINNLLDSRNRYLTLLCVISYITSQTLIRSCGLETGLLFFLILLCIKLYLSRRHYLLGFFVGLLPLVRLEGLLLIPILYIDDYFQISRKIKFNLLTLSFFLFPIASWYIFSYIYFNDILPNSVYMKLQQGRGGWGGIAFYKDFLNHINYPFIGYPLLIIGFISTFIKGNLKPIILISTFGLSQLFLYSVMSAPVGYFWYHFPSCISLNFICSCGALTIYEVLEKKCKKYVPLNNLIQNKLRAPALTLKILFLTIVGLLISIYCFDSYVRFPSFTYRLSKEYRLLGESLNNPQRELKIAAGEIGYLGYYSGQHIIDINRLIYKHDNQSYKPFWWFEKYDPDYIVSHNPAWRGEPSEKWPVNLFERFKKNYYEFKKVGSISLYKKIDR